MIYRELTEKEYADAENRILYEDNHLLVVNKRAGEIVQADMTQDETLADFYRAFIAKRNGKEGGVFLGIPHRLDRPVSGVTVFARTSKALERLNAMFRSGDMHKFYWALVCSRPVPDSAELSDWLVRNEKQNKSYIYEGNPEARKDAKLARLKYRTLGHTDRYWLVEVGLLTGRHHQIRCQHKGGPEIWCASLQSGRRHLPSCQKDNFCASGEENGDDDRGPAPCVMGRNRRFRTGCRRSV